jgi:hypothetical protein
VHYVNVALLLCVAAVIGVSILALLPTEYRNNGRGLMLAPALGGLLSGSFTYVLVIIFNGVNVATYTAYLVAFAIGVWLLLFRSSVAKDFFANCHSVSLVALFALLLVAFPFQNHLGPPDVDAQTFGLFAYLIKADRGFPLTQLWPELGFSHYFTATAANAAMVAVFAEVSNASLLDALNYVAFFWVVCTALLGHLLILELFPQAPKWLQILSVLLVFNSAVFWEYGDGSFNRPPATVATLLLVYLAALATSGRQRVVLVLLGLVHGATFYFHYRFFAWNSLFLAIWGLWHIKRWRDVGALVDVGITALTVVALIGPYFINNLIVLGTVNPFSLGEVSTLVQKKHNLSPSFLSSKFLNFHGWITHPLALTGVVLYLHRRSQDQHPLLDLAGAHYLVMFFFCIDSLVVTVLPFTYGFLYSDTAVISTFLVPKLVFLLYVLARAHQFLPCLPLRLRVMATGFVACGLGVWGFVLISRIFESPRTVRLLQQFLIELPYTAGTEYIYAVVALAASTLILAALLFKLRVKHYGHLLLGAFVLALFSNEAANGKLNYSFIGPADRAAFDWIRQYTDPNSTLVLTASTMNLERETERGHAAGVMDDPPIYWGFHWLVVGAERSAVFTRLNLAAFRDLGILRSLSHDDRDYVSLDWAYWNPADSYAQKIMRDNKVTHVYYPPRMSKALDLQTSEPPGMRKIFETPPVNGAREGAVVLEVIRASDGETEHR